MRASRPQEGTRRVQLVREGGTRRVQLVREGGGGASLEVLGGVEAGRGERVAEREKGREARGVGERPAD